MHAPCAIGATAVSIRPRTNARPTGGATLPMAAAAAHVCHAVAALATLVPAVPCGAEEAAGVPQKSGSQGGQARVEAKTTRCCESKYGFGESGCMTLKPEKC